MRYRQEPPRLVDCQLHGPGAELFVVEGDSAALAVGQVRDARTQAVLAMQGKPLNALRASAGRVATNPWYRALVGSIGTGSGAAFDLAALRYERVLLLTDPDADGIHCGALLLLFFHRWLPALLERGHVWLVRPPFGEVDRQDGQRPLLVYSEPEFQSVCNGLRRAGPSAFIALRYRGLGSLGLDALESLCVNPGTRRSRALTPADAEAAMEVFDSMRDLPPQRPLL
jgi:DNA gyrase subunit B